jgi:hypothetical protein
VKGKHGTQLVGERARNTNRHPASAPAITIPQPPPCHHTFPPSPNLPTPLPRARTCKMWAFTRWEPSEMDRKKPFTAWTTWDDRASSVDASRVSTLLYSSAAVKFAMAQACHAR